MELKVFDYDCYDKDLAAQHIAEVLKPLCKDIEGLWLYREPEIRTEGNELPTFTLVSPNFGICFIKVFSENSDMIPKTLRQGDLVANCKELLEHHDLHPIFDCVLIDEAQDFPLEFFLLVERVTKEPKKIVIAYDELQTTNDIHIPEFEQLFGSRTTRRDEHPVTCRMLVYLCTCINAMHWYSAHNCALQKCWAGFPPDLPDKLEFTLCFVSIISHPNKIQIHLMQRRISILYSSMQN